MKNIDRIRALPTETIALILDGCCDSFNDCNMCPLKSSCEYDTCICDWKEWLEHDADCDSPN